MQSYHTLSVGTSSRRAVAGLTLIELTIVLLLTSVLVAVGLPSFRGLAHSVTLTSVTNDLFGSLLLARSQAITHNGRVTLCKKSPEGDACAASGGWEQGWIMFDDANADGWRGPGEAIIANAPPFPTGWRASGNMPVSRYISFDPHGGTKHASSLAFQAGTITLCRRSDSTSEARQIILNGSGRPRIHKTSLNTC